MGEEKIVGIIEQLRVEVEGLRDRINSNTSVVCNHVTCDACNQKNIAANAERDSLMVQLREKESLISMLEQ